MKGTTLGKKIVLKSDEGGKKYFYYNHFADNTTGKLMLLCGLNDKGNMNYFDFLKINTDASIEKRYSLEFEKPQQVNFFFGVNDEKGKFEEIGAFFNNKENCTYVSLDSNLTLINKIEFKIPEDWDISNFTPKNKIKYFYGNCKKDGFAIAKIENDKLLYITKSSSNDFEKKIKFPPSQSKISSYDRKNFEVFNGYISKEDEILLYGQNYKDRDEGRKYKDAYMFYFNKDGNLKVQYGFNSNADEMLDLKVCESEKNLYWYADGPSYSSIYSAISKINKNTLSISDFINFRKKNRLLMIDHIS